MQEAAENCASPPAISAGILELAGDLLYQHHNFSTFSAIRRGQKNVREREAASHKPFRYISRRGQIVF